MSHYPDEEEKGGRKDRPAVASCEEMSLVDKTLGQILEAVARLGLKGNTYVVDPTDHGTPEKNPPLTIGKSSVWEGGCHVPFIVAGLAVKSGDCSHGRVTATDLLPTFASLSGIK